MHKTALCMRASWLELLEIGLYSRASAVYHHMHGQQHRCATQGFSDVEPSTPSCIQCVRQHTTH